MVEFSTSAKNMRSSEIRRLLKIASDPSIISFSAGMPNNELFPTDLVAELYNNLALPMKQAAFQYCPTDGYPPFLEALKSYLKSKRLPVAKNRLLVTAGAQQAINLVSKVLVDPGDTILTEYPSFIGAVAAFKSYGAKLVGIDMDSEGIIIEELEKSIARKDASSKRVLYVTPYFHNPAGIIYSQQRKTELLKCLGGREICLLEDDPYGEIYFEETTKDLTLPMMSFNEWSVPICYIGSLAKIFGPGMRIGWIMGPSEIIEKCELAKQSMDSCTSTFTQVLAYAFLTQNRLTPYVTELRKVYKRRAQIMLAALDESMPEGVTWTRPKGGFYIWVTLPEHINSSDVFDISIKNGAAFVIGKAFDPEGKRNNCFRLSFSHTQEDAITEGIKIVCDAVRKQMMTQAS